MCETLYNVICVPDRAGSAIIKLTSYPTSHQEATTILSKITKHKHRHVCVWPAGAPYPGRVFEN